MTDQLVWVIFYAPFVAAQFGFHVTDQLVWVIFYAPFVAAQFGFDFGGIGDALAAALGEVAAVIADVFIFLWNALVLVFQFLFAVAVAIFNFFLKLLQGVGKAFGWLWEHGVKTVLSKALNTFVKVRDWLQKVFAPLIKWLRILRQWQDQFFNRYVRPVLNLIQHIRSVLAVFRIFHLHFADALDKWLGKLEGKIIKNTVFLRQKINQILSFLELIVDPSLVFRRVPWLARLNRSIAAVARALRRSGNVPLTTAQKAGQQADAKLLEFLGDQRPDPNLSFRQQYPDFAALVDGVGVELDAIVGKNV